MAVMIITLKERADTTELHRALATVLATIDVGVEMRTSLIEGDEGIFKSELDSNEIEPVS